jgi:hypothetical protein
MKILYFHQLMCQVCPASFSRHFAALYSTILPPSGLPSHPDLKPHSKTIPRPAAIPPKTPTFAHHLPSTIRHIREVAQAGSAPGLGPGGRRFESCLPDHFLLDFMKPAPEAGFLWFEFDLNLFSNFGGPCQSRG